MDKNCTLFSKNLLSLFVSLLLVFVYVPIVRAATPPPLFLFFSGNVQGETAPCG